MPIRAVARDLWFPGLLLALFGYALATPALDPAAALGVAGHWNGGLLIAPAVVAVIGLVAGLERALPHRTAWNRSHGDVRTDLLHGLVSGPVGGALFEATLRGLLASAALWLSTKSGGSLWPNEAPLALQLGLALVAMELGHYAWHRVAHEWRLAWPVHAVHHSATRLYWLNAYRFHALDSFFFLAFDQLLLVLLGAGPAALLAFGVVKNSYGLIQHGNVDVRTPRLLDWIFSTPGLHRRHHAADARESSSNYGAVLNCWDLVFGSFERSEPPYAGAVGIDALPHFPQGFVAQTLSLLRWKRTVRESV